MFFYFGSASLGVAPPTFSLVTASMAARAGVSDVLPQRVHVSIPGAVLTALLEASQSVRGNTEGVLLGDSSLARCRAPPTDGSDAAKVVDSVTVGACGLGGTGLGLVQLAWPSPDGPAGGGMRMPPGVQRFSEIGHGFSFYGTSGELQWDVLGPALRHSAEEVRAASPPHRARGVWSLHVNPHPRRLCAGRHAYRWLVCVPSQHYPSSIASRVRRTCSPCQRPTQFVGAPEGWWRWPSGCW